MVYKNRIEAGKLLGFHIKTNLKYFDAKNCVVLGLAHGGVVVGSAVAAELGCQFDVLVVKKIGHPENPEYAGAAVSSDEIFINSDSKLDTNFLANQAKIKKQEIKAEYALYWKTKKPIMLENQIIFIVDDGIATGLTMKVAIAQVKLANPKKIYIGVPVAAASSLKEISTLVDGVFCLYSPHFFAAVGQFYQDFDQVSDNYVIKILKHGTA